MSKTRKRKKSPKKKAPKEDVSAEPEEEPSAGVIDIAALPIWQIIPIFIGIFDRVAWQRMGMVVNPMTQQIEKDLDQARVAIDSYEALFKHLGDNINMETKKVLEARLTDLKLNFAQQA